MSLEEKSKALEEMKKMHEQIKEHLHSEGLEKATQLTEAKTRHCFVAKRNREIRKRNGRVDEGEYEKQRVIG